MTKNLIHPLFVLLTLIISSEALAERIMKLSMTFTPSGSFEAVSEKIKGNVVKRDGILQSEKLWVNANTFRTEVNLRDEHFANHLKNSRIVMTNIKAQNGKGEGTIEINQVKKPVSMSYVEKDNHVEVSFDIDASEFNLPKAGFLGIGVSNQVKVWAKMPYTVYVEPAVKNTNPEPAPAAKNP